MAESLIEGPGGVGGKATMSKGHIQIVGIGKEKKKL